MEQASALHAKRPRTTRGRSKPNPDGAAMKLRGWTEAILNRALVLLSEGKETFIFCSPRSKARLTKRIKENAKILGMGCKVVEKEDGFGVRRAERETEGRGK
jgi:hypothetical protein